MIRRQAMLMAAAPNLATGRSSAGLARRAAVAFAECRPRDTHRKVLTKEADVTEYEIDTAADQIMHWVLDELEAGTQPLEVRATREYSAETEVDLEEAGVSEDAELASLATIGILEVSPIGEPDSWLLRVRVEDIVGPHTPEEDSVSGAPEEIDLEDFIDQFIAPDRGAIYITVDAPTPEAKRHFDRLFANLVRDRHAG